MNFAIWNLTSPLRSGTSGLKLLKNGRELFGTVIKSGYINKTVTVRVDYQYYVRKYRGFGFNYSKFLCHDEENFCVEGDKVVIKTCLPISVRKHYYIRNIVKPFPRNDYYVENQQFSQKNQIIDEEYKRLYKSYFEKEIENSVIKNKKQEHQIKSQIKAKAMAKAIQNLRKLESDEIKKSNAKKELSPQPPNQ